MFGLDGFDHDAEVEARFFQKRIPVYARVLRELVRLLADDGDVRARMEEAWAARDFQAHYERPLLICAALRQDALALPDHPLRAAIGAVADPKKVVRSSLTRALAPGAPAWRALRSRWVSPIASTCNGVSFESAPRGSAGPVALRVRVGERTFEIASGDYHPSSLRVENGELGALALALGAPPGYPPLSPAPSARTPQGLPR